MAKCIKCKAHLAFTGKIINKHCLTCNLHTIKRKAKKVEPKNFIPLTAEKIATPPVFVFGPPTPLKFIPFEYSIDLICKGCFLRIPINVDAKTGGYCISCAMKIIEKKSCVLMNPTYEECFVIGCSSVAIETRTERYQYDNIICKRIIKTCIEHRLISSISANREHLREKFAEIDSSQELVPMEFKRQVDYTEE